MKKSVVLERSFFVKKSVVLLFAISIASLFSFAAFALGVDDGTVFVTEKKGEKYLGSSVSKWCTYYVAADGSANEFYRFDNIDLNEDGNMDICDLVKLSSLGADINGDENADYNDAKALRLALIGITDQEERG